MSGQPPPYRGRPWRSGPWWLCHLTPCHLDGEQQAAKSRDAATAQAHAHYMTHHYRPPEEPCPKTATPQELSTAWQPPGARGVRRTARR